MLSSADTLCTGCCWIASAVSVAYPGVGRFAEDDDRMLYLAVLKLGSLRVLNWVAEVVVDAAAVADAGADAVRGVVLAVVCWTTMLTILDDS